MYGPCAVLRAGCDRDEEPRDGCCGEAGAAAGLPQEDPHSLDRLPQLLRPGQRPCSLFALFLSNVCHLHAVNLLEAHSGFRGRSYVQFCLDQGLQVQPHFTALNL